MDSTQLRDIINRNFQEFTRKVLDETHAPDLEQLRHTMYYGDQAYTAPFGTIAHLILHMEQVIANHIHPPHVSHENVNVSHFGQIRRIDRKIAPLISEIWRLGLSTLNSCENNVPQDYMWIEFADEASLRQFVTIVLTNESEQSDLGKKVLGYSYGYPNAWQITISYGYDDDDETMSCPRVSTIEGYFHVRFPSSDYDTILEKFFQYSDQ
jgi:hypothetical protein